jgi:protein-tyrosine phosphatase
VKRVLFVCLGNICRSPTAEGVMHALLAEHGLEGAVEVDSAGTIAYHIGEGADPRMQRAAAERGYSLDSISRQVDEEDFERFDLVVAMDRSNREDLEAMAPDGTDGKLRLLSDFLPDGAPEDVPDPYWGGAKGFDRVLDLIEEACPRILEELLGVTLDGE